MEQRLKESLSALLDGEADELELQRILALTDEAELRALWARYHRVRTVMGSDDPRLHHFDISASVAAALAQGDVAERAPVVVPQGMSAPLRSATLTRSRLWQLSGVAASVAVAFAVGFSFQKMGAEVQSPTANPVASVAAVAPVPDQPNVEWPAAQSPEPAPARAQIQYVSQLEPRPKLIDRFSDADARRFNGYLLRHAEQSALSGRQGMAPFARVASFNSAGLSGSDFER
jgi:sigma-E factor negative regulatory protein RseA